MDIEYLKNTTEESRTFDSLRQLPISIRRFIQSNSRAFDADFNNRASDTMLSLFTRVKYPITDRTFGSPNADICNIFLNMFNQPEINELIEDMVFNREWIFHPVRPFEKWHNLSKRYYGNESYFWLILLFNRVTDPFRDLQDFNIVRIPNFTFLGRLPSRMEFDYSNAPSFT
jgi:hypothetical protein